MTCSEADQGIAAGAGPTATAALIRQTMTAEWFMVRTALFSASQEKTAVIRLRGELDVTVCITLAELLEPLSAMRLDRLVIDLNQVDFLDCGTAAVIFEAARKALPPGEMPIIRVQRPLIRRLLQLTGLDSQCVLDIKQAAAAPAG
jgi:anti-sigma B factor antagonist